MEKQGEPSTEKRIAIEEREEIAIGIRKNKKNKV